MTMTKQEQKDFIVELIKNVKKSIIEKTAGGSKIPENWNGLELRWLVKDSFSFVSWGADKRLSVTKTIKTPF